MSSAPRIKHLKTPEQLGRKSNRLDLRPSDGVHIYFKDFSAQSYDISPFGFGIILDSTHAAKFSVGSETDCEIFYPPNNRVKVSVTACWIDHGSMGKSRIGFRYSEKETAHHREGEIEIPDSSPIAGFFYSSGTYYERASFLFHKLSEKSAEIQIFDSATMLIPGMKLDLRLHQWDNLTIKAEVISAEIKSLKSAVVQIRILEFPISLREKVANFIFSFSDLTYTDLKVAGLIVSTVAEHLRFRYIKTEAEYNEVLELRFKAYKGAGKVADGKVAKDMAAPLDHISRILAAYHGDKIVASVSITYPQNDETVLDTERPFGTAYPKKVPPKTDMLEVSRLCTDNEYRGSDLLVRMFEYLYKAMHCGNRTYAITSADDNLLPLYQSIGFKKTGMSYDHPYLAGIKHHVILVHRDVGDSYRGFSPIAWTYLYSRMNKHLQYGGSIEKGVFGKIRLQFALIISKVVFTLLKLLPRKASRRSRKR